MSRIMSALLSLRNFGMELLTWELEKGRAVFCFYIDVRLSKEGRRKLSSLISDWIVTQLPGSKVYVKTKEFENGLYVLVTVKLVKNRISRPEGFSDLLVYQVL